MSETTPPDRLSIWPDSPFFDEGTLNKNLRLRFNGKERHDAEEYCMSEGWIRVSAGRKSLDRRGRPMTLKLTGKVEAVFDKFPDEAED
ncbi:DUF3297 family protein [Acetobacteraceae bacterium]|nr:DUF3297 family protein [Acetobacteraceae bacterium]